VVFHELARRFPKMTIDDAAEPTYMDRRAVRAYTSLSVILG
jgi:hypothetical protein